MSGYCGDCPKCESELEFERFDTGTLQCPSCGEVLVSVHECCYDADTNEEYCYDYLITRVAYHRQMQRVQ